MRDLSYEQYASEANDWLKRGRALLLGQSIERHLGASRRLSLLDVGAGVGQNVPALAKFGDVDAVEVSPIGQEALSQIEELRHLYTTPVPFDLEEHYDVVCALDVIEHLEDDRAATRWMSERLVDGGLLFLTVPAYQWLFTDHDRALGHYRRYTRRDLLEVLPTGVAVLECAYFNHFLFPAAVASRALWVAKSRVTGAVDGKQPSPKGRIASTLLHAVLAAEVNFINLGYRPPWGLSLFCTARRS